MKTGGNAFLSGQLKKKRLPAELDIHVWTIVAFVKWSLIQADGLRHWQ